MKTIARVLNTKTYFPLEVFIKLKFKVIWEFKKCNEKWFLVLHKVWVVIWTVIRSFFYFPFKANRIAPCMKCISWIQWQILRNKDFTKASRILFCNSYSPLLSGYDRFLQETVILRVSNSRKHAPQIRKRNAMIRR